MNTIDVTTFPLQYEEPEHVAELRKAGLLNPYWSHPVTGINVSDFSKYSWLCTERFWRRQATEAYERFESWRGHDLFAHTQRVLWTRMLPSSLRALLHYAPEILVFVDTYTVCQGHTRLKEVVENLMAGEDQQTKQAARARLATMGGRLMRDLSDHMHMLVERDHYIIAATLDEISEVPLSARSFLIEGVEVYFADKHIMEKLEWYARRVRS